MSRINMRRLCSFNLILGSTMTLLLCLHSRDEAVRCIFHVFDTHRSGRVLRDDFVRVLSAALGVNDTDSLAASLSRSTLSKARQPAVSIPHAVPPQSASDHVHVESSLVGLAAELHTEWTPSPDWSLLFDRLARGKAILELQHLMYWCAGVSQNPATPPVTFTPHTILSIAPSAGRTDADLAHSIQHTPGYISFVAGAPPRPDAAAVAAVPVPSASTTPSRAANPAGTGHHVSWTPSTPMGSDTDSFGLSEFMPPLLRTPVSVRASNAEARTTITAPTGETHTAVADDMGQSHHGRSLTSDIAMFLHRVRPSDREVHIDKCVCVCVCVCVCMCVCVCICVCVCVSVPTTSITHNFVSMCTLPYCASVFLCVRDSNWSYRRTRQLCKFRIYVPPLR
jgi:hypothetical protein